MKNHHLAFAFIASCTSILAQQNTAWYPPQTPNTSPAGYIGIGTKSTITTTNTPLPSFNLHLHGTTDYIADDGQVGMGTSPGGDKPTTTGDEKVSINYGKTTRLGFTNTVTGLTELDGTVLQMSGNDFTIANREAGRIYISTGGASLTFALNRNWMGGFPNSNLTSARFNIESQDNGVFIRTTFTGKYGINIRMHTATDKAFQVLGTDGASVRYLVKANGQTEIATGAMAATDNAFQIGASSTVREFAIKANGEVYARKYTTTLQNIPDYVFAPNYDLKTFDELRTFVNQNQHLPNVPSAKEYEQTGVDLGEMNRILLEKVEELTLYILQLETRTKQLEEKL